MSFKSFMSPVPSCHVPSFSVPLRSSSEKRISLKSFFQPTKSLPLNPKNRIAKKGNDIGIIDHQLEHIDHIIFSMCSYVFICFPYLFSKNFLVFHCFFSNTSYHIIASLLDIHQKGFDRCLTSKPLENWLLVGRFMGLYMFLWFSSRFFVVFLLGDTCESVKKWIRRTGSTSAGATPCKPNTQACHFGPSFDRRSRSGMYPCRSVSLCFTSPQ